MDAERSSGYEKAYASARRLVRGGLVDAGEIQDILPVIERYPVRISSYVARHIDSTDPSCPLRCQFVPAAGELEWEPGHSDDPLNESVHMPLPGLVHRYPDRILLHVSADCASLCRFCFRKSLLGNRQTVLHGSNWPHAMAYLAASESVREVILSGGDPFTLPYGVLMEVMRDLTRLPRTPRIRVHTRVPVVDPERITGPLIGALSMAENLRLVVHVNHPAELVAESLASLDRLSRAGFELLSQSVLLKGVNDRSRILRDLFSGLMRHGIQPYYLHHTDPARGTAHFSVTLTEGAALFRKTRASLPDAWLPRYVVDLPELGRKTEVERLVLAGGSDRYGQSVPCVISDTAN